MFKQTQLENGLRIVTEQEDFNTVTVGVYVGTGSNNESEKLNGISHVLEHMVFKGTTTRNAQQLADMIESLGGYCNAWTGNETTAFYTNLLPEYWKTGVDFLGDILQNSTFPEDELESEKNVILQEISMYNDNPQAVLNTKFIESTYAGTPAARDTIGTEENVKSFTSQDLRDYMSRFYCMDNMVVSACGNIDHDEFVEYVKQVFTKFPEHCKEDLHIRPGFNAGKVEAEDKFDQARVFIAFEGFGAKDEDQYVHSVFNNILDGMSNRLFQEVREKRGLAYSIGCGDDTYTNYGLFAVSAGVSNDKVEETIKVCKDVLDSMKTNITDAELIKAKNICVSNMAKAYDSCTQIATLNGCQWLHTDKIVKYEDVKNKLLAITKEQVFDFANKYLREDKMSIAVLKTKGE